MISIPAELLLAHTWPRAALCCRPDGVQVGPCAIAGIGHEVLQLLLHVLNMQKQSGKGQPAVLNLQVTNKVVIKSRQLGLSEMCVMEMVHFADLHSYANVKCLFTFPK